MLKNKLAGWLLLLCLTAAQAQAASRFNQVSLTLDITTKGAFSKAPFSPGLGFNLYADWRMADFIALGTGFDFTGYFNYDIGGWQTSSWVCQGRIFPFPSEKGNEFYLQGGLGLNLLPYSLTKIWPAPYQGTAGLGYRIYVAEDKAMDLGAQYEFFNHLSNPLHAIGLKVGWTFLL